MRAWITRGGRPHRRGQYAALDDLFRAAEERGEQHFSGGATAFETRTIWGIDALHLLLRCARRGHPQRGGVGRDGTVMKASAVLLTRLPIARVSNLAQAIRTIKERNIFVCCADLGGARWQTDLSAGGAGLGSGRRPRCGDPESCVR